LKGTKSANTRYSQGIGEQLARGVQRKEKGTVGKITGKNWVKVQWMPLLLKPL